MTQELKKLSKDGLLQILAERGIKIALDDFGCGCCGGMDVRIVVDDADEYTSYSDESFDGHIKSRTLE